MVSNTEIRNLINGDVDFTRKCSNFIEENINVVNKGVDIDKLTIEIENELNGFISNMIDMVASKNSNIEPDELRSLVISVCESKYKDVVTSILKSRGLLLAVQEIPNEVKKKNVVNIIIDEEVNNESAFQASIEDTGIDSVINVVNLKSNANKIEKEDVEIIVPTTNVGEAFEGFGGFSLN